MKTKKEEAPVDGSVNNGISNLPIVKYVKTNKGMIITGIIAISLIAIAFLI